MNSRSLTNLVTGVFTVGFLALITLGYSARVLEFWEDPANASGDDDDAVTRVKDLSGADIAQNTVVIDGRTTAERPVRGSSGLAWGAYNSATGGTNPIQILNRENQLGAGTLRNSTLFFRGHAAESSPGTPNTDFNLAGYNEQTGSYIYTLFDSDAGGAISINMAVAGALFKIGISHDQTGFVVTSQQTFRLLVQTGGSNWYRSKANLQAPNVNVLAGGLFGNTTSDSLTPAQREALMSSFTIASITAGGWERISASAEQAMNDLADGSGAIALGASSEPNAMPNLTNVTGMGVLLNELSPGDAFPRPAGIHVIGMLMEGGSSFIFEGTSSSIAEGSGEGVKTHSVNVIISEPVASNVTVDFATVNGTATGGLVSDSSRDFTSTNGTLTFTPGGGLVQTIDVGIFSDDIDEGPDAGPGETFVIRLSNPVGLTLAPTDPADHTVTITDDDTEPNVFFNPTNFAGFENAGSATLTLELSQASGLPITVDFTSNGITATPDVDYPSAIASTVIPIGQLTHDFSVPLTDDPRDEDRERFQVSISGATNATVGAPTTTNVFIDDDDAPPTISLAPSTGLLETSGTSITFAATLSEQSEKTIVVDFASADMPGLGNLSATAGVDYDATSGQLTFNPLVISQAIPITINDDILYDGGDEQFSISLSNLDGNVVTAGNTTGIISILDDEPMPTLGFTVPTQSVPEELPTLTTVDVLLSGLADAPVEFDIDFVDGDAVRPDDYFAGDARITIPPVALLSQIAVLIFDDGIPEDNETFSANLSNVTANASLGTTPTQVVSIVDNDVPVQRFFETWGDGSSLGPADVFTAVPGSIAGFGLVNVVPTTATDDAETRQESFTGPGGTDTDFVLQRLVATGSATLAFTAPIAPSLDDDAVDMIELEMTVFYTGGNSDSSVILALGSSVAPNGDQTLPGSLNGDGENESLSIIVNNVQGNLVSFGVNVGLDPMGGGMTPLESPGPNSDVQTAGALPTNRRFSVGQNAGLRHEVIAQFTKNEDGTTKVAYFVGPLDDPAGDISTGGDPDDPSSLPSLTLNAAFPSNVLMDEISLFFDLNAEAGVDNISITTFGSKTVRMNGVVDWEMFD